MRLLFALAWRNLWRHRRRSLITAAAMSIGVGLCMAMMSLTDGMGGTMERVMVDQRLGHVQLHHPDYPGKRVMYDTLPDTIVAEVEGTAGVRATSGRLFGGALVGTSERSTGAQLVGVVAERERDMSQVADRISDGTYLGDTPDKGILVGPGLMDKLGLSVGQQLTMMTQAADGSIGNENYTVQGVFRTGDSAMEKAGIYMHLADLQELLFLPEQVHEVVALTTEADTEGALATTLKAQLGGEPPPLVRTWSEADPQTAEMLGMMEGQAAFMLIIVFSVASIGVLNTMLMSVFERTRELGVIKALGMKPRSVVVLILFESLCLGLLACAGGLALGGLLDWYLVAEGIDFADSSGQGISSGGVMFDPVIYGVFETYHVVATVVCVLGVSVFASIWPAWRAARLRPVVAMRTD